MKAIFEANDNPILVMSDEAHFNVNGIVNQQNCRYWTLENPRQLHAKPLHYPKVIVWCAVGNSAVIGFYFLEDNNGNPETVNERYTEMIKTSLCLNYDESVFLSDVCAFIRMKRRPI